MDKRERKRKSDEREGWKGRINVKRERKRRRKG
jgi:hypothetical protein